MANSSQRRRFNELRSLLPGITEKMLAQQLKELERDKLILKEVFPVSPPKVEYYISEEGMKLQPLFTILSEWGIDYLKRNGIDYMKDQELYK